MSKVQITRREFLRAISIGASAVTLGPLVAACATPTATPIPPTALPAATVAATTAPTAAAVVSPTVLVPSAPFKLGSILPYTKVYAELGEHITNAMTLYFESVNFTAGGRKIEWIKEDEENDAQISLRKLTKLIDQDKVNMFAGIVSTAVLYAVRDPLHEAKLPTLISNAGGNQLTRKGSKPPAIGRYSPYIFRASFSSYQISNPLGDYVAKNVSKKAMVCASNYGFGTESAADFKATFTAAGGTVIAEDVLPPLGTNDFSAFLPKIAAAKPETVFSFFSGSDALNYVKQFDQFGLKKDIKLVGAGFLTEYDALPGQGKSALDIVTSHFWSTTLDNPANKKFMDDYRKRFPNSDVSGFAVQGYDTARVIVEALNAVKGDTSDKQKFLDAIKAVKFDSPRGPFAFDPVTQNVVHQIYFRQVKETSPNKFENVIIGKTDGAVKDPENL